MSQEKIEFVSGYLNYNKCGCCSLAIAESDGFYQINSAHNEIFNLLFIAKNIEVSEKSLIIFTIILIAS